MTDHERLTGWDAAYVLGALSSADRREFEVHLSDCARCRDAIAELTALPGLLGRLERGRAFLLLEPDGGPDAPPVDLVERIVARQSESDGAGAGTSRRRALIAAVVGFAAAVIVTVAGIQLIDGPSGETVEFQSVTENPLSADAEFTAVGWGTRIDLVCSYAAGGEVDESWRFTMWVIDEAGNQEQVSSWNAQAGATAHLSAATSTSLGDIDTIEIRAADGGTVLTADVG